MAFFLEERKEPVDALKIGLRLPLPAIGTKPQIILHTHRAEDLPTFRRLYDPCRHARMRRQGCNVEPIEHDPPAAGRLNSRQYAQERRLASTVGADERDDFTRCDRQGDGMQDADAAIAALQPLDAEQGCLRHDHHRPRPYRARDRRR